MNKRTRFLKKGSRAFTLVEVIVATGILILISITLIAVLNSTRKIWRETTSRAEQFREARRAFERITIRLSQATLNPYWDYVNAAGQPRTITNAASFVPAGYARQSELRYIQVDAKSLTAPRGGTLHGVAVFFQAPTGVVRTPGFDGMDKLLNTIGFFLEQGSDATLLPSTIQPSAARNASSSSLSVFAISVAKHDPAECCT